MVGQPGAVLHELTRCDRVAGVAGRSQQIHVRGREQTGDGRVQVQPAALLQAQRDGGGHGLGVAGGAERRVHGQRAAGGDVGQAGGNAPGTRRAGAGDAQGRGRVQREDRGVQGVGVQACSLGLCVVRHVRKARGIRCGLRALRPPSSGTQPGRRRDGRSAGSRRRRACAHTRPGISRNPAVGRTWRRPHCRRPRSAGDECSHWLARAGRPRAAAVRRCPRRAGQRLHKDPARRCRARHPGREEGKYRHMPAKPPSSSASITSNSGRSPKPWRSRPARVLRRRSGTPSDAASSWSARRITSQSDLAAMRKRRSGGALRAWRPGRRGGEGQTIAETGRRRRAPRVRGRGARAVRPASAGRHPPLAAPSASLASPCARISE